MTAVQAVLLAAVSITLLPVAIIAAVISISGILFIGIPVVLGGVVIALPVLVLATVFGASYVVTRWAYGVLARGGGGEPVGSGNSASFRPAAAAEAKGNDVRGYLELNLVKVEDKKVEGDARGRGAERVEEKEGRAMDPYRFLTEK